MDRPIEQRLNPSYDESVSILVSMKSDTPSMAGWNVEFVLENLFGVALVTKTSPTGVTIDNGATPKTLAATILRSELVAAGVEKGRQYNFKFRRTDNGAEKRLAEGPWYVKEW